MVTQNSGIISSNTNEESDADMIYFVDSDTDDMNTSLSSPCDSSEDNCADVTIPTIAEAHTCKEKSTTKIKKKRLNKAQEKELKEQVYQLLREGIPPRGISLILGITLKKVTDFMSGLLFTPKALTIQPSKFAVISSGSKIKDISENLFDDCEYVQVHFNEEGSVIIKAFIVGDYNNV